MRFFVVEPNLGSVFLAREKFVKNKGNVIIYVPNNYEINKVYNLLSSIVDLNDIIQIPTEELIRVEYLSSSKEILAQQIYGLYELMNSKHKIIIVSPSTVYHYFPSKETFQNNIFTIKVGEEYNLNELKQHLTSSGYLKVNKIDQSLQFASRGDIVDVFTLNYENPIRIEFFGDQVESIRFFDIANQTSIESIKEVVILPGSLNILTEIEKKAVNDNFTKVYNDDLNYLAEYQKDTYKATFENDLEEVKSGIISQKNYKYYSYLQTKHYSLLDYCDDYSIIVSNEEEFKKSSEYLFNESHKFLFDLYSAGKSISHLSYFDEKRDIFGKAKGIDVTNSFFLHENSITLPIRKPALVDGKDKNILLILKNYLEAHLQVLLLLNNEKQIEQVKLCLDELKATYTLTKGFNVDNKFDVSISLMPFSEGFELKDKNIVVLTSNELFGRVLNRQTYSSKFKEGIILGSYLELTPGDYVVHEFNGIGQFIAITTLLVDGKHDDYIQIAYAKGDKVYVPLYQFNLIRKYVGKDGTSPRLNTLGGNSWENTKKRVKEKINDLAERLLTLYQERSKVEGFAFKNDEDLQAEFENKFEFALTEDQKKSLDEIKKDMESSHPMDRLLCGDVGFGKTEIAFRAAFKAILSGKQVCFLCPTTLLARQHYEVALERFKDFGVRIAMLSRLVSEAENKSKIALIKEGKIDLVIGTHKVLSKSVEFKNLGLLMIDEEQRFGVEQKEKIKEKKLNVDVLTISATPIPRTLQSSLIGLKSVSTIETPPKERMPIQTYVIPFSLDVVKDLIKRELARGGQVFYVYNEISSIYNLSAKLKDLLPECRFGVIHGKMEKDVIEEVMNDFYQGDIDVLIATSIIENGIDVRNANLMLVQDADHFGLSQLYQIKGRVGRGDKMAFAYLMINEKKEMNEQAQKRLKSIQDFTELGSGYKIAQRDLLIRGAGDILGPQQAGFIDEVGVDMYIRLLNEAINEKKNGKKEVKDIETFKLLNIDAYIPSSFATDEDKIEIYQKILETRTKESLETLKKNIIDMYGPLPESMELLFEKRLIDIYLLDKEVFNELKEFPDRVELVLSQKFSGYDGIGSSLFTSLIQYINQIKISFHDKMIEITIFKRSDWLILIKKIMEIVDRLYNYYKRLKENDANR